jgi:hypothetical protein
LPSPWRRIGRVLATLGLVLFVAAAAYLLFLRLPPAPLARRQHQQHHQKRQQHQKQQWSAASNPRGADSGLRFEPEVRSLFANALGAALDSSAVHAVPLGDDSTVDEHPRQSFTHTFAAPPKVVPFVGRHFAFDFADCDARVLADAAQLEAILARALRAVVCVPRLCTFQSLSHLLHTCSIVMIALMGSQHGFDSHCTFDANLSSTYLGMQGAVVHHSSVVRHANAGPRASRRYLTISAFVAALLHAPID